MVIYGQKQRILHWLGSMQINKQIEKQIIKIMLWSKTKKKKNGLKKFN